MPDGFININKPTEMTSHDVVAIIRRSLPGRPKVGHTGTLDPDATGVLPVCVGKATRLAEYFDGLPKVYIGELELGFTTDTLDISGNELSRADADAVAAVTEADFLLAMQQFIGEIEQIPPMVSAVKIGGKKLYQLAHKGIEIERPTRKVQIYELEVVDFALPKARLRVKCSGGTYIRTLFHDIGQVLGVGATLTSLCREETGGFYLDQAIDIWEAEKMLKAEDYSCFVSMEQGIVHMPTYEIPDEAALDDIIHGRLHKPKIALEGGIYRAMWQGKLAAMVELIPESCVIKAKKVFWGVEQP